MALATQCPACETVFRISTTQAAAKSGMVRCGQCRHVFNSLDALVRVEDLEFVAATPDPPRDADEHDPALEPHEDDVPLDEVFTTGPPPDGELLLASAPVDHDDIDLTVDDVDVDTEAYIDDGIDERVDEELGDGVNDGPQPAVVREWWVPDENEVIVLAPEPSPAAVAAAAEVAEAAASSPGSLADQRLDLQWPKSGEGTGPEFMRAASTVRPPRSRNERIALVVLALVAALGLLGQAAYVWRDEVAARWPASRGVLAFACESLRCRIDYPRHLDAITIESSNVQLAPAGGDLYTLSALLRNRDAVDVRYPMLALTLTDTQDQPILRRVLRPEDYLDPARSQAGFAAESELPVRVMFELADLRFVGYRLERFYP